ncbi:MAG: glycosyltransferase family 4 protein [Caldilineaceae bacterium]
MTANQTPRLLIVGPLPPPINGTGVSFQLFCDELAHYPARHNTDLQFKIIDSSPRRLKEKNNLFSLADQAQTLRILLQFCRHVWWADHVMVFGSTGFLLMIVPLLLVIAKIARKPYYVRAFGGSLDRFSAELPPMLRRLLLFTLRRADGLLVQTQWLYDHFRPLIGDSVHLVPGYRGMAEAALTPKPLTTPEQPLRLAFVGIVKAEKGVFTLLESLRQLDAAGNRTVECHIFGPQSDSSVERFNAEIGAMRNARYQGVLKPGTVVTTLRDYDALVLPSTYEGEGHPGVLIEAMMAGIPAIAANFRAIPELIEHGRNGLLVAPEDAGSLADAIRTLDENRELLAEMSRQNWERRTAYDARHVIPLLLQPLGLDLGNNKSSLPKGRNRHKKHKIHKGLRAKFL